MRALLLAALLFGCASEEPEPSQSLAEKQCAEGGRSYKIGASWSCSDGCNQCKCVQLSGEALVETTTAACDATPPFVVDSAMPVDTGTTVVSDSRADG